MGKRMEHVVSGIKGIVDRAPNGGLDAGAILDGIANDQGGENAKSNANAGDIANQVAGGGSPSLDQIISGLDTKTPAGAKNQSRTPEQGQVTEKELLKEEGKGSAQSASGNGLVIEVGQTTIKEANGQEIKTEIVKEVGQTPAAEASAKTSIESIPAEVRPTPPPTPMPGMPAKGEPAQHPPAAPAPPAESLPKAMNTTAAAEAAQSTPAAHVTQSLAEASSAMVRAQVMLMR